MSWTQFQENIRRAFSEAAPQYDFLTDLHKEIGRELVQKMAPLENVTRILDVGTGTGYLAKKAKYYFPSAEVVGLDLAAGMLDVAQASTENLHFVEADAQTLPLRRETFDAVVSNLAYQWLDDLPKAFGQAHRVLTKGGKFYATVFGFFTLDEFFQSDRKSVV